MEEMWLNEVNIHIKVRKHSETLKILDFFRFDAFLYIVTELCPYGDLQQAIENRKKKEYFDK